MNSNEIFIGREAELDRFRKDVFFVEEGSYGYCSSLIGLNGIGKTALIRRLSEEFECNQPEKTFYYATTMEDGITYWSFWINLIYQMSFDIDQEYLSEKIPSPTMPERNAIKKILALYDFVNTNAMDTSSASYKQQFTILFNDLFKNYTTLGIRIIITIDEFDRAQQIFKDGQFFQKLFSLSPKGSATRLNLSIITISRRRVSTIAHHMQDGSSFEAAYPTIALKGFTNQELNEYFETYRSLPCGYPTDEEKQQILYLCGRSPDILMPFRHELETLENALDVSNIYSEHGLFIKNSYNRMITLLESTYADRAHQKPLLEVFIQYFIGPVYDDSFDMEVPMLYDYGFVLKSDREDNGFSTSKASTSEEETNARNRILYEPIAPYFIEYIKHFIIPNALTNLSGLLIKAEKLIREVIEKEMRTAFSDSWEKEINQYADQKDYYLETLQIKALQNDFSGSSISKLNVISFKEYYYIIKDHWNLFEKYFTAYADKQALYQAMSLLSESRNTSAHLNLVVYNGENRRKLREACELFINCLDNDVSIEEPSVLPTEEEINNLITEATKVTFCCQAIKMPKKNLRGIIKEFGFAAGIAQSKLEDFGFTEEPKVGDEYIAIVERWDANAKIFNLKAPN